MRIRKRTLRRHHPQHHDLFHHLSSKTPSQKISFSSTKHTFLPTYMKRMKRVEEASTLRQSTTMMWLGSLLALSRLQLASTSSTSCPTTSLPIQFQQTLQVNIIGNSASWTDISKTSLETALIDSYNEYADCGADQGVGSTLIKELSVIQDPFLQVVLEDGVAEQYSIVVEATMECTGSCNPDDLTIMSLDTDRLLKATMGAALEDDPVLFSQVNSSSATQDHNSTDEYKEEEEEEEEEENSNGAVQNGSSASSNGNNETLSDGTDPGEEDYPDLPCHCEIPSESTWLTSLSTKIQFDVSATEAPVQVVVGIEETEALPGCLDSETTTFESYISLSFQGASGDSTITEDDLIQMELSFLEAYNAYATSQDYCDPMNRIVTSVVAERDFAGPKRNMMRGRQLSEVSTPGLIHVLLKVGATCRGTQCSENASLFDYQQESARRLDIDEASCFCPLDSLVRGPSEEEIFSLFESKLSSTAAETEGRRSLLSISLTLVFSGEAQVTACDSELIEFTSTKILELALTTADLALLTPENPEFQVLADNYVLAYNRASLSFCDDSYRTLMSASVSAVVPSVTTVSIQLDLVGLCRGCDPATTDVFDTYTFSRRLDQHPVEKQRFLQDGTCYCPLSPSISGRGTAEEDLVPILSEILIADASISIVSDVKPCDPVAPFEASLLIRLESTEEFSEQTAQFESAFITASNRNLRQEDRCDPTEREVILAEASFVTVKADEGDEIEVEEAARFLQEVTGTPSVVSAEPSAMPTLSSQPSSRPSVSKSPTSSSAPTGSFEPSSAPSISPAPTPVPSFSPAPTNAIVPGTFAPTRGLFSYLLLSISGECRGCATDSFLTNEVSGRRLLKDALHETLKETKSLRSSIPVHVQNRFLADVATDSSCYCPIDVAVVQETEQSLSIAYQESLEKENVNANVADIKEVKVKKCRPNVNRFDSEVLRLDFTASVESPNFDNILRVVKSSYNIFAERFCDPLFRRVRDITLLRAYDNADLVGDGTNKCQAFVIEFTLQGECKGCDDDTPMLVRNRGRLLEESEDFDFYPSTFFDEDVTMRSLNNKAEDDRCYCNLETIADRAPTFSEFRSQLNVDLASDRRTKRQVCDVVMVTDDLLDTPAPTQTPSAAPSSSPSDAPSDQPSDQPSDEPSDEPSDQPSDVPSASPSDAPSSTPTICRAEGTICEGRRACRGADPFCAWTGSCNGDFACRGATGLDVEERGCLGVSACDGAEGSIVADDSCVDETGDGEACLNMVNGAIGTASCRGTHACADSTTSLVVGDSSCLGVDSCRSVSKSRNRQTETTIGSNSCSGQQACQGFAGVSIGDNSCNCFECCACWSWDYPGAPFLPDDIPSSSCNTPGECCPLSSVPSSSPSAAPSVAPSAIPSTAPSVAPSAGPSARPSVGPSSSPSKAPTGLPSAGPTGAPSKIPTASPTFSPTPLPTPASSSQPSLTATSVAPSFIPSLGETSMFPSFTGTSIAPSTIPSLGATSIAPSFTGTSGTQGYGDVCTVNTECISGTCDFGSCGCSNDAECQAVFGTSSFCVSPSCVLP